MRRAGSQRLNAKICFVPNGFAGGCALPRDAALHPGSAQQHFAADAAVRGIRLISAFDRSPT